MSVIDYSLSKRGRLRKKLQKLVVGLTLSGLVFSGLSASLFMNTTAAYAAPLEYGYGFNNPSYDYILGSWRTIDGNIAYCIQLQVPAPDDTQVFAGEQNNVTVGDGSNISGVQVAQLNYVLNKWGNTTDDLQAAAVAWAVWYLTDQVNDQGIYTSFDTGFEESIFTFAGNQAQANLEWDDDSGLIVGGDLYDMFIMMTTEAVANGGTATTPPAPANISISGSVVDGEFVGTATVPAGYTQVTISNATFDSNNSGTVSPNGIAGVYDWTANAIPDTATTSFTVSATGSWEAPKYGESVNYWRSTLSQDLIAAPPLGTGSNSASVSMNLGFSPELTTQVPVERIVGDGSGTVTISDTVTFNLNSSVAAPFNSSELRQFADGSYAEIFAEGTLYGPLAYEPVEDSAIPAGTPIAGTTSITTSPVVGFGEPYTASVTVPDLSGFYTWVWKIETVNQPSATMPLMPSSYSFQDNFGIPEETSVVPTKLTYTTELTTNRGEAGTVAQDELTTAVDGLWIQDASGDNVPATLTGTVYYHGTSAPVQQATVPASAEPVQTLTMEVSEADEVYTSDDIVFPDRLGFYTVQWCTEYNNLIVSYCDDYGVSSETFEVFGVTPPDVTTQAELTAKFGEEVRDTAYVTGDIPENTSLRFTAYREAVVGDPKFTSEGAVLPGEFWTAEDLAGLTELELCEIQPIGTTGLTAVNGPGEYLSDPIATTPAGSNHRMYWVEYLITIDPETGEETLLVKGDCGEPTEITYVSWPTITTNAGGNIAIGESRGDRTSVLNANPDLTYYVTHELYFAGVTNEDSVPVCDVDNLVFSTSEEPLSLTGSEEYEFVSAPYTYEKAGTYYWIEKLWLEDQEVASGFCGNPDETVNASDIIDPEPNNDTKTPPPAAAINGTATPVSMGMLAGGVLLVLGGAVTALVARRVS